MNYMANSTIKKSPIKRKALKDQQYSMVFVSSIEEIREEWSLISAPASYFLSDTYLKSLENNPPAHMEFGYLMFFHKDVPVGIAAMQTLPFKADKSINDDPNDGSDVCFFRAFGRYLKGLVASKVEFTTLICGNMLITGEHGFYFNHDLVSEKQSLEFLEEGLEYAQEKFGERGIKADVTL
ncbi:MAG: hypothetical protein R2784_16360 [Saprospiraceae bacterium]